MAERDAVALGLLKCFGQSVHDPPYPGFVVG
jgi:hypothetical protein